MNSVCRKKIRGPGRRLTKLWAALVALGLLTALMAACNGGDDGASSPTAQPTGGGSPAAQSTPQAATSAACQALTSLKKYRYHSTVILESPVDLVPPSEGQPTPVATLTRPFEGRFYFNYEIDGSLIAPDKVDALIDAGTETPFNLIVIGQQSWVTVGGQWQASQNVVPYMPLDICNALFPEIDPDQAQGEEETVNDVAARHYTFTDISSGQFMATTFGPEADMTILFQTMDVEVWLAEEDGWPVRMDIQASGLYGDRRELKGHILVELRDINADDIKIEPPA